MGTGEVILRILLLLAGLSVVGVGAHMKNKQPDLEVTPLVLIVVGFICMAVSTSGLN